MPPLLLLLLPSLLLVLVLVLVPRLWLLLVFASCSLAASFVCIHLVLFCVWYLL
jgi:hypothetical protein